MERVAVAQNFALAIHQKIERALFQMNSSSL
jgi:hypothetical protein